MISRYDGWNAPFRGVVQKYPEWDHPVFSLFVGAQPVQTTIDGPESCYFQATGALQGRGNP